MKRIDFRGIPGCSALFLDYLYQFPKVAHFYSHAPTVESVAAFAKRRPKWHSAELAEVLAEQQKQWGGNPDSVAPIADGAVAVITGQQAGLFTGPMFTILKAWSAILLSRKLNAMGVPALPVFWIASEDHDHDEIRRTEVLDADWQVRRVEVPLPNPASSPVGWLHFSAEIERVVDECTSALPASEFLPEVRELLRETHRIGDSPVHAFGRIMARIFSKTELVFADPLQPDLKKLAMPMLRRAADNAPEIRRRLGERGHQLREAGYHEQVLVSDDFTGLFRLSNNARVPYKPSDSDPIDHSCLSPNALLRPIIQDSLFSTAAYIAGPAEIAYFAQSNPLYELLDVPCPPVVPRISATVLDPSVSRSLAKYGLQVPDCWTTREILEARLARTIPGADVFDRTQASLAALLDALGPALSAADPTLMGALETARRKMQHQVRSLGTKFANANFRRSAMLTRHRDQLSNSIFPDRKLQERSLNVFSFIGRYGPAFISLLGEGLSLETVDHQVLEL